MQSRKASGTRQPPSPIYPAARPVHMASNILSRFLPPAVGEPSVYETLQQHDEVSDLSDIEERAGMTLDDRNLEAGFHDYELDDAIADDTQSQVDSSRMKDSGRQIQGPSPKRGHRTIQGQRQNTVVDDVDDEVPQSLLVEAGQKVMRTSAEHLNMDIPSPVPGPAGKGARSKWQAAREQQRLHQDPLSRHSQSRFPTRQANHLGTMGPKERAMWMWANVENLDNFLMGIYDYFLGNGIWCILLSRILNLL